MMVIVGGPKRAEGEAYEDARQPVFIHPFRPRWATRAMYSCLLFHLCLCEDGPLVRLHFHPILPWMLGRFHLLDPGIPLVSFRVDRGKAGSLRIPYIMVKQGEGKRREKERGEGAKADG